MQTPHWAEMLIQAIPTAVLFYLIGYIIGKNNGKVGAYNSMKHLFNPVAKEETQADYQDIADIDKDCHQENFRMFKQSINEFE